MSYPPDPNSGSADALRQLLKVVLYKLGGAVYLSEADMTAVENMSLETEKRFDTEERFLVVRRAENTSLPPEYVRLISEAGYPATYSGGDDFAKDARIVHQTFTVDGDMSVYEDFTIDARIVTSERMLPMKFFLKKEPTVMAYKHKMNPVDVVLWTGAVDPIEGPVWLVDEIRHGNVVIINAGTDAVSMRISGRNGTRTALPGDMIVRNDEGEVFPMRVEDFERHYEMVG